MSFKHPFFPLFFFLSNFVTAQVIWEDFEGNVDQFDLDGTQVTFFPSGNTYLPMRTNSVRLPVSTDFGIELGELETGNGITQVSLMDGNKFSFFGVDESVVTFVRQTTARSLWFVSSVVDCRSILSTPLYQVFSYRCDRCREVR